MTIIIVNLMLIDFLIKMMMKVPILYVRELSCGRQPTAVSNRCGDRTRIHEAYRRHLSLARLRALTC